MGWNYAEKRLGKKLDPEKREEEVQLWENGKNWFFIWYLYELGMTLKLRYAYLYWEAYKVIKWLFCVTHGKREAWIEIDHYKSYDSSMLSFCVPFFGGDLQVVYGDLLRLACKQNLPWYKNLRVLLNCWVDLKLIVWLR